MVVFHCWQKWEEAQTSQYCALGIKTICIPIWGLIQSYLLLFFCFSFILDILHLPVPDKITLGPLRGAETDAFWPSWQI